MPAKKKTATKAKPPKRRKAPRTKSKPAVSASKKKARRTGRPPFKPTEDQRTLVESLVGYGLTQEEICTLIVNPTTGQPIEARTLQRHFRAELDRGAPKMGSMVAQSLVRKAVSSDHPQAVAAAIFYLKTRRGWTEKVTVEHEGRTGVLVAPGVVDVDAWIEHARERNEGKAEPGAEGS